MQQRAQTPSDANGHAMATAKNSMATQWPLNGHTMATDKTYSFRTMATLYFKECYYRTMCVSSSVAIAVSNSFYQWPLCGRWVAVEWPLSGRRVANGFPLGIQHHNTEIPPHSTESTTLIVRRLQHNNTKSTNQLLLTIIQLIRNQLYCKPPCCNRNSWAIVYSKRLAMMFSDPGHENKTKWDVHMPASQDLNASIVTLGRDTLFQATIPDRRSYPLGRCC